MIVLTLRTDKPEAEIGLYKNGSSLTYHKWQAHRKLAETIHKEIKTLLEGQKINFKDIGRIIVYQGPGSFTGLRISISVANALADSLNVVVIGTKGDDWIEKGLAQLAKGENDQIVTPFYCAPANITQPKK